MLLEHKSIKTYTFTNYPHKICVCWPKNIQPFMKLTNSFYKNYFIYKKFNKKFTYFLCYYKSNSYLTE